MDFFKWNDEKMNIGIDIIDQQHKELLKIINQLSTSINRYSQKEDILIIVDDLIKYATFHFKTEEELFDKFMYKDSEQHKKEHSLFSEKFLKIRKAITTDEVYKIKSAIAIADEIFTYIVDWFLHHILESDKKFVKFFKEV